MKHLKTHGIEIASVIYLSVVMATAGFFFISIENPVFLYYENMWLGLVNAPAFGIMSFMGAAVAFLTFVVSDYLTRRYIYLLASLPLTFYSILRGWYFINTGSMSFGVLIYFYLYFSLILLAFSVYRERA